MPAIAALVFSAEVFFFFSFSSPPSFLSIGNRERVPVKWFIE
jgi:hypothetical protein